MGRMRSCWGTVGDDAIERWTAGVRYVRWHLPIKAGYSEDDFKVLVTYIRVYLKVAFTRESPQKSASMRTVAE